MKVLTARQQEYYEYLQTGIWFKIRDSVVLRDEEKCRICNSEDSLNVHHRCYPEVYGKERKVDLITLCRKCHELFHGIKQHKEKKIRPPKKKYFPSVGRIYEAAKRKMLRDGIISSTKKVKIRQAVYIICENTSIKLPTGKDCKERYIDVLCDYTGIKKGP